MKKYEIVKKAKDFDNIIKNGKYIKNKYFCIYYLPNNEDIAKFGLAVSKKCGNAVTRNKIKRQIRMLIDDNKKMFPKTKNYIIMVKRDIKDLSFSLKKEYFLSLITERKII